MRTKLNPSLTKSYIVLSTLFALLAVGFTDSTLFAFFGMQAIFGLVLTTKIFVDSEASNHQTSANFQEQTPTPTPGEIEQALAETTKVATSLIDLSNTIAADKDATYGSSHNDLDALFADDSNKTASAGLKEELEALASYTATLDDLVANISASAAGESLDSDVMPVIDALETQLVSHESELDAAWQALRKANQSSGKITSQFSTIRERVAEIESSEKALLKQQSSWEVFSANTLLIAEKIKNEHFKKLFLAYTRKAMSLKSHQNEVLANLQKALMNLKTDVNRLQDIGSDPEQKTTLPAKPQLNFNLGKLRQETHNLLGKAEKQNSEHVKYTESVLLKKSEIQQNLSSIQSMLNRLEMRNSPETNPRENAIKNTLDQLFKTNEDTFTRLQTEVSKNLQRINDISSHLSTLQNKHLAPTINLPYSQTSDKTKLGIDIAVGDVLNNMPKDLREPVGKTIGINKRGKHGV